MNFFDHKDLGNHLLQLCPEVVKHPIYIRVCEENFGNVGIFASEMIMGNLNFSRDGTYLSHTVGCASQHVQRFGTKQLLIAQCASSLSAAILLAQVKAVSLTEAFVCEGW